MAWYSSLGNVKLSRTNLGFLNFGSMTLGSVTVLAFGFAAGSLDFFNAGLLLAGWVGALAGVFDIALVGALPAALRGVFAPAFLAIRRTGFFFATGFIGAAMLVGDVSGEVMLESVLTVDMTNFKKELNV